MKKFLFFFAAITISCGSTNNKSISTPTNVPEASGGTEIIKRHMLVGEFQKEDLIQEPFTAWFNPNYENYNPEEEAMNTIKKNIDDYKIKVLMGTWCRDSKREVPKLLKILDQADFNYDHIDLVGVDRYKKTPSNIEEELDVFRVPTIIFYKNGKEVNRFVEYSQEKSIEMDIAKILSGKEYKNSYAN